ncbi:MAG: hypothetical protein R6U08_03145 [Bacillota bacterium]
MKKVLVIMALVAAAAVFSGCSEEVVEEEFDEADLVAVDEYIEEMNEALLDLKPDLQGWIREPYQEELPLRYDEERIGWLKEQQGKLAEIENRYRNGNFPTEEEITSWQVVVVRGEKERLLEGSEVLAALDKLEQLKEKVSGTIEMIETSGGELNMEQSEEVMALIDDMEPIVEEIRAVFFR